ATRPFEAEVVNVWAALSGGLLSSDGARDDSAPRPDAEQFIQLRLRQATAYLAGSLVRLRAIRDFKSVTPLRVESANCVFQSAGNKSLVHLDGPNPGEELMKSLVAWSAESNWYGGFENLLDNQTNGETMAAPSVGRIAWSRRQGETDSQILQMAVLTALPAEPLTLALPEQFRLNAAVPTGRGAVIDSLPRPAGETQRGDTRSE